MVAAGLWPADQEILDTLDIARILMPDAASHSLPLLAVELGLEQPRPHRALDDADATRQLFLRMRELAAALDDGLKESILALVAPYAWAIASFFAEALTAPVPVRPRPLREEPAVGAEVVTAVGAGRRGGGGGDDPRRVAGVRGAGGPLAAARPGSGH